MAISLFVAAAMAASPVAVPSDSGARSVDVEVAFEELSHNRAAAAIARIEASGQAQSGDPASLINLGTAYARIGQRQLALALYRAAIASSDRYDLQLADGRWMDSRAAARLAAAALERGDTLVMR
jgi:tetratricopeptide (TPR) repeat protein